MGLYEDNAKINIIPQIKNTSLKIDLDGKVRIPRTMKFRHNPWIENDVCQDRNCNLWLDVYFKLYHVIPRGCMACWKTYYIPKSLEELFEVHKFQQDKSMKVVPIPAKCGIETRPYSGRLGGYAAFWYNPLGCGLSEARRNTYKLGTALGKELSLKRGCTEMEQYSIRNFALKSDDWDKLRTSLMDMKEALLDATFVVEGQPLRKTPTALQIDIIQTWIEHAVEHGDMTYRQYTDQDLIPKLMQYSNSIHNIKDFPNERSNWITKQEGNSGDTCKEESLRIETLEAV